jgi:hypothetical protein
MGSLCTRSESNPKQVFCVPSERITQKSSLFLSSVLVSATRPLPEFHGVEDDESSQNDHETRTRAASPCHTWRAAEPARVRVSATCHPGTDHACTALETHHCEDLRTCCRSQTLLLAGCCLTIRKASHSLSIGQMHIARAQRVYYYPLLGLLGLPQ